jgi:hypothetical protein
VRERDSMKQSKWDFSEVVENFIKIERFGKK